MNDIQTKALHSGLALLRASGAQYVAVDSDGIHHNHGGLTLAAPELPRVEPGKRTRVVRNPQGTLKGIYLDAVTALKPGDMFIYEAATKLFAEDVRAAASAHASKTFGNGSCMSTVIGNRLELLRVT